MHQAGEVVFCDEFLWNFGQLNFHIFWSPKWGAKVKNFNAKARILSSCYWQDTIDHNLEEFEWGCVCPNIYWIAYICTADCYSCNVWVFLYWSHFTNDWCVTYFIESVFWYVFKFYYKECICAFNYFPCTKIQTQWNMLHISSLWSKTRQEWYKLNKNHNLWYKCMLSRGCWYKHSITWNFQIYDQQCVIKIRS